jgi:hypothetical protein
MQGFYYEFQDTLLLFVIISHLTKPSLFTSLLGGFVSLDFTFMIMLGSKEIAIIYSLPSKVSLNITFIIINLQIYRTTPLTTNENPDGKGCLIAQKLEKESEKLIYC